jgi:hypothetical protein
MANQLVFGSAYPFKPLRQAVDGFRALGLRADVIDKVMYENAAALLKIPLPAASE